MKKTLEQIKAELIGRRIDFVATIERAELDKEARTVPIAITSDKPIQHWFGALILNHSAKAIRLDRMKAGAPALLEHDRERKIGGLLNPKTDGKVLRATVKFSRDCEEADREMRDIEDGIARSISGGFILHEIHLHSEDDNGNRTYQSDDWEPLEASFVTIPADISVGVGRSLEAPETRENTEDEPHADDCECEQCAKSREDSIETTNSERSEQSETETRAQEATQTPSNGPRVESVIERSKPTMTIEQLIAMGAAFGQRELAEQYCLDNSDASEEGLKALIREKRAASQTELPKPKPRADLGSSDRGKYSMARAINAAIARAENRPADANCLELEVSDDIERSLRKEGVVSRGGIFVPTGLHSEALQRAGLDTATATAGQENVYTEYGGFIEFLYNMAKVLGLGVTRLSGLQGNVSFLKQTGKATAEWIAENPGSDASESNLTTGSVVLSPKSLIATTSFSRQLMAQSVVNIETMVQQDLAKTMALAVDRAAIHGSGSSNQPLGIYGISGVNAKAFGGAMTKDLLTDMETLIAEDNADLGSAAFLTTPGAVGKAKKTLEFSAAGSQALYVNGKLNGIRCEHTNQVSAVMNSSAATGGSSHGLVLGTWSEFLWGEWGAMELIVDPYRLKKQAMVEITSFLMCDFNVRHPEAFCKATGQTV